MKIIIQDNVDGSSISMLLVPEGYAETLQLAEIKSKALELKLEHWDSDTNGLDNWTKADQWGFNLVLTREAGKRKKR